MTGKEKPDPGLRDHLGDLKGAYTMGLFSLGSSAATVLVMDPHLAGPHSQLILIVEAVAMVASAVGYLAGRSANKEDQK